MMPNRERFDYTYSMQQSKDFSEYTEIDTTKLNPKEISDLILTKIS